MPLEKIAYLIGAGATHAEIMNLEESPSVTFIRKNGLKISDVSNRVMKRAQNNSRFKKYVEEVTYRTGTENIELLISLFESNQIPDVDYKVNYLKKLVEKDIMKILSPEQKRKFYLHKALFELHKLIKDKEWLTGVISLNYDDISDLAYEKIRKHKPNYGLISDKGKDIPLLKLHGSFNWTEISIFGKKKTIPIIPLGLSKNYLIPPYNFIWSKTLEVLVQCDKLRVIGCSLSQNDIGLIDLLFKAHLERSNHFIMEIIDTQGVGEKIKKLYGFFPGIKTLKDIEGSLIPGDINLEEELSNPFKIWLKAKAERMLSRKRINITKYLKKVFLYF